MLREAAVAAPRLQLSRTGILACLLGMREQTGISVLQNSAVREIHWLGGLLKEIVEPLSRSALVV
jgi:hypothetical protein